MIGRVSRPRRARGVVRVIYFCHEFHEFFELLLEIRVQIFSERCAFVGVIQSQNSRQLLVEVWSPLNSSGLGLCVASESGRRT